MTPTEQQRFKEGLLSTRHTALLFGVTEQEFKAEWERQRAANPHQASMVIPKAWIRQGKEIAARLAVESVEEALELLEAEQANSDAVRPLLDDPNARTGNVARAHRRGRGHHDGT